MRVNVTPVGTWITWLYWRGTRIWEVSIKGGSTVHYCQGYSLAQEKEIGTMIL